MEAPINSLALTDDELRICIIEAVNDGDASDAFFYAQSWYARYLHSQPYQKPITNTPKS